MFIRTKWEKELIVTQYLKKTSSEPHFITRADLNVLVRDLNLSKSQDEILALRLKGWDCLQQDSKLCYFFNRQDELKILFNQKSSQYCVMILVLLLRWLDIDTIEDSGDPSSIFYNLPWRLYSFTTKMNTHRSWNFHYNRIQWSLLGQTAASRCEHFSTFQGLTLSLSSGCVWI